MTAVLIEASGLVMRKICTALIQLLVVATLVRAAVQKSATVTAR